MTADDCAVCPQSGAFFDNCGTDIVHLGDFGSGVVDIGEYHRWPAEYTIFESNAFVNTDVVLDFAFVTDSGVGTDDAVLANVAVLADFRTAQDMREMPDFRFFANSDVVIDDGSFVVEKTRVRGKAKPGGCRG